MKPNQKAALVLQTGNLVMAGWCAEHPGHNPEDLELRFGRHRDIVDKIVIAPRGAGRFVANEDRLETMDADRALMYAAKGMQITNMVSAMTGTPVLKEFLVRTEFGKN